MRNAGVRLRTKRSEKNAGVRLHAMWLSVKTTGREGGGDLGRMSPCVTPDRFPFRALAPTTTTTSASLSFLSLFSTWNRGCEPLPSSEGCGPGIMVEWGYIPRGDP